MRVLTDKAEDQIEQQIIKYLAQLKGGELRNPANPGPHWDCGLWHFRHRFVVADIVGDQTGTNCPF